LAYDVERNSDLFFRDVSDGANSLVVGRVASLPSPLIIVGGNCSVLGFNREGDESFWTVTGDNVTSLEICDIDSDGNPELIVGSEDFELRIFRHEELLNEISETDKVIFLKTISKGKFAYGLANGTVGVYKGLRNRLWRVKSKYVLSALEVFDMDNDGVVEVISGFTNGSFTVRNETSGEIKFKGSIESSIVAMLVHDYRLSGKLELIVCAESGEVRGYLPAAADSIAAKEASLEELEDQKILSLLQQTKSDLNNELRMLEQGFKNAKSGEPSSGLPLNTSLSLELFADVSAGCVSLLAGVNTEVSIISLIVMDLEGATLTGSEVQAVSPAVPSRTATLHLMPSKPNPCTLKVQVHVALRGNTTQMHVIEAECFLPKFASFGDLSLDKVQSTKPPKSCVSFELNETLASLSNWLKSSFLITQPTLNKFVTKTNMRLGFASVCGPLSTDSSHKAQSTGGQLLFIDAAVNADAIRLQFNCENMDICGEIVQDIARYFKIQDLNTVADFPKEFRRFEAVLANVAESNASRQRLAADMADDSQRVKVSSICFNDLLE
jgi:Bardet-Biedl syndrome 2 protein